MAVIGINYSGGDHDYDEDDNFIEITPVSYESVYLHTNGGEFIFKSGNFVKDWFQAKMKYAKELMEKEPYLSGSSTCDNFFMDGAKYDSAYLHIEEDKPVLKYVDTTDPNYFITQRDIYENGWEMFVDTGTKPTWEELKKSCTNEGTGD
jgi:hypothetical protein